MIVIQSALFIPKMKRVDCSKNLEQQNCYSFPRFFFVFTMYN